MGYLLDANVFIEAKNRHYGFDICPAFWDWLLHQNALGRVFSIARVGEELDEGADELAEWANSRGPAFFLPPDVATLQPALTAVSRWASRQHYAPAAVHTFMQAADFYLVAHALAQKHVVVTHEVPAPTGKQVKVPTACVGMSVKWMTPFEMLRVERARFVLGPGNPRPRSS
ncbi:MAG: DUF4411 family protein [Myxococcales bacterium]|nr:DUF4411 family protein [Myxococcales bacterium]